MMNQIQVEDHVNKAVMPDNFAARIAFVDYNGKSKFKDYINNKPKTNLDKIEFIKRNAPLMVCFTESLRMGYLHQE